MKKATAWLLFVAFLCSLAPSVYSVEPENYGEATVSTAENLSGRYYDEIFGDGSPYQVVSIEPMEAGNGFVVACVAEKDTRLLFSVTNDDTGEQIFQRELFTPKGEHSLEIEVPLDTFPEFYRIEAVLSGGGRPFTYYRHTHAWQDFLALSPNDDAFDNQVVITCGEDSEGRENFVVVREDVKVVRVESMDDTQETDGAALMSILDKADGGEEYTFANADAENAQVLAGLESGDKLLILPLDSAENAKTLVVGAVEERAALLSGDKGGYSVTSAKTDDKLEDFFTLVRIRADVEMETGDIDTSKADDDLEIKVVENEEAELLSSKSFSKSASKSLHLSKSFSGITVTDNFTLSASVSVTVYYSFLKLQSVSATASVSASNHFRIHSNYSITYSDSWNVGTIYPGSVAGVNFEIPVYVTLYINLGASFNYEANQYGSVTIYAYYDGYAYCSTSHYVSADKTVTTNAYATARLGVKANINANVWVIPLSAALTGEVGVEVKGSIKKKKFKGDLYGYVQPSLRVTWRSRNLVNKTWPIYRWWISSTYSKAAYLTMDNLLTISQAELQAQIDAAEDGVAVTVDSAEELRKLAEYTKENKITKGVLFILNQIEETLDVSGADWTPIGTPEHPFMGSFDGSGVTITGLRISGVDYAGLFGVVSGAEIHDVTLKDAGVTGAVYAGGIAGCAKDSSWIYDVAVSGAVNGTSAGGLVGSLEYSSLLNSYSGVAVTGGDCAGGTVGKFLMNASAENAVGQIVNCYVSGNVTAPKSGAICGIITPDSLPNAPSAIYETGYAAVGVTYCYFLSVVSDKAVGERNGGEVKAWPVMETQASGTGANAIAEEDGYEFVCTGSLLEALNRWYAVYGARQPESSVVSVIPEASEGDSYNRWYASASLDGAYPGFSSRETVYPLYVSYVDENGADVFAPVTRYLGWASYFRVDALRKDGFHIEMDESKWQSDANGNYIEGYMTPDLTEDYELESDENGDVPNFTGLEFRFVYVKDSDYAARASSLSADNAAENGKTYEIRTLDDLQGLSAYTNAGGSTVGATFEQTQDIDAKDIDWTPVKDFQGVYLGNDLEIQNLQGALFDSLSGAEVTGIRLADANVATNGALANVAVNSQIEHCMVSATVGVSGSVVGGLLGSAENCMFKNCSVEGVMQGRQVGGLAGSIISSKILNCFTEIQASGSESVGGIAASLERTVVENSYTRSAISGHALAGGLSGSLKNADVKNVYVSGTVSGVTVGALTGSAEGTINVENVFVPDNLTANIVGIGNTISVSTFRADADGYQNLMSFLNAWVSTTTDGNYFMWTASETEGENNVMTSPPTLGFVYKNWIMNFKLEENKVAYQFDTSSYGNTIAVIAVYNADGKMLNAHALQTGDTGFEVETDAVYAVAFLLDDEFRPLCAKIRAIS